MSIRIVTHCWAKYKPQYAEALKYQLSSLLLNSCKVPVSITICYSLWDRKVSPILDWFVAEKKDIKHLCCVLTPERLVRRPIGREIACYDWNSDESILWFTDCDYVFGPGCLDAMWDCWQQRPNGCLMIWPKWTLNSGNRTNEYKWTDEIEIKEINPEYHKPRHNGRAIGGLQITDSDVARKIGYLKDHEKYQTPSEDDKWIRRSGDDVQFRRDIHHYAKANTPPDQSYIPNNVIHQVDFGPVYRIGHQI